MRYFTVLFFLILTLSSSAQKQVVKGNIINELSKYSEPGINIINLNSLKVSKSDKNGYFEIEASLNDSLHFSSEGYRSLKLKVTNDWLKNQSMTVYIKDNSTTLEEMYISTLTQFWVQTTSLNMLILHLTSKIKLLGRMASFTDSNRTKLETNGML